MSLLPLARSGRRGAESQVAMRLQWAQAEFLGPSKGLAVVGNGLARRPGVAPPGGLAGSRWACAWWPQPVWARERSRRRAARARGFIPRPKAGRRASLSSVSTSAWRSERLRVASPPASDPGAAGLRRAPGQGIRRTQERGHLGEWLGWRCTPRRQTPFKQGDGLLEHSSAAVAAPHATPRRTPTVGLRHRLSQSYGFFASPSPLGEAPQFGEHEAT